jgi:hypothetical protein
MASNVAQTSRLAKSQSAARPAAYNSRPSFDESFFKARNVQDIGRIAPTLNAKYARPEKASKQFC